MVQAVTVKIGPTRWAPATGKPVTGTPNGKGVVTIGDETP